MSATWHNNNCSEDNKILNSLILWKQEKHKRNGNNRLGLAETVHDM